VEVRSAPVEGRAGTAAGERGRQTGVGEGRLRRSPRTAQRLEKAQVAALMAVQAVSSYSEGEVELPVFFGRLTDAVARLVGARRAAFWRLAPDRVLGVQPRPSGFAADSPIHDLRIRLPLDGDSIVERVVFRDELDLVKGTSAELDAFWGANGLAGVRNSIAVSWRAGEMRLGALVAYDSRRGFSRDDAWVLRITALATGLMWQYEEAEKKLGVTAGKLEKAAIARRQLLANIAAGGDEARRRFASALHDDSLQLLTAAELQVERTQSEPDPTQQMAQLDQLKGTLRQVEDSLRRLLLTVSPQGVDLPLGLDEAIRTRLEALRARTGIELDVDVRLPGQVSESVGSVIFKNMSEALTNAEKHAHATSIRVSAHAADGGIRVVVADDGKGFVVAESMEVPGHYGLTAIRERAQMAGGSCRIASDPGAGALVEFWIPAAV
jgi:signal transduction histidine kinase